MKKLSLSLLLVLCSLFSYAQDIAVEPIRSYLRADSIHAKFGEVFTENDPFGRKAFVQWIVKDAELIHIALDKPVLFVARFTVDYKGRNKNVKVLKKGNSTAARLLATAIEEAPRWTPYMRDGIAVPTDETIAFVLLPAKTPGGELRGGTSIAPLYPEDGIMGFLSWVELRSKDADWRYNYANLLKQKHRLQVRFTIEVTGDLTCDVEGESNEKLNAAIKKLFAKGERWQPGIYITRLCPFSFVLPIEIDAWNERQEGERISRQSQPKKTQLQLELEQRYRDRQQQH